MLVACMLDHAWKGDMHGAGRPVNTVRQSEVAKPGWVRAGLNCHPLAVVNHLQGELDRYVVICRVTSYLSYPVFVLSAVQVRYHSHVEGALILNPADGTL